MSHLEILELVRFALRNAMLSKDQVEAALSEMRHAGIIFFDAATAGRIMRMQKSLTDQYEDLVIERSQVTDLAANLPDLTQL